MTDPTHKKDLTYGYDARGDYALFIEIKHFGKSGWNVIGAAKKFLAQNLGDEETEFFRLIVNGEQQHSHGWVNANGDVVQWG